MHFAAPAKCQLAIEDDNADWAPASSLGLAVNVADDIYDAADERAPEFAGASSHTHISMTGRTHHYFHIDAFKPTNTRKIHARNERAAIGEYAILRRHQPAFDAAAPPWFT